jgi:hypothetical protein
VCATAAALAIAVRSFAAALRSVAFRATVTENSTANRQSSSVIVSAYVMSQSS